MSSIFELKNNENCDICENQIKNKLDINHICIPCEIDLVFEEFLYLMVENKDPIHKLQKDGYNIVLTDEKEYCLEY